METSIQLINLIITVLAWQGSTDTKLEDFYLVHDFTLLHEQFILDKIIQSGEIGDG